MVRVVTMASSGDDRRRAVGLSAAVAAELSVVHPRRTGQFGGRWLAVDRSSVADRGDATFISLAAYAPSFAVVESNSDESCTSSGNRATPASAGVATYS